MYTFDQLVDDLAMEIIYGCDRFDKYDVIDLIESFGKDKLREAVRTKIITDDPDKVTYDDKFLEDSLNAWFR